MHTASDTDSLWSQMLADIKFALSCTSSTKEVRKRASVSLGLSASEEERMATYASDSAIMNSIAPNALRGPLMSQLRSNVMAGPPLMLPGHPGSVAPCDVCYAASSVINAPTGPGSASGPGSGLSIGSPASKNVMSSTLPPPLHPPPNPPGVNSMPGDLDLDSSTMSSSMRGNSPPPFGELASTSLFHRPSQSAQQGHC